MWNRLIFDKYRNLIKIDSNKIDNELENASDSNKDIIKRFSKYTMTSNVKIFSLIKSLIVVP